MEPELRRIVATVEASLDTLVEAAAEAIWAEVPAYQAAGDDKLRADVSAHVRAIFARKFMTRSPRHLWSAH